MSITYFECVFVALGIQHEKHTHCIILSAVASLVVSYFTALSQKRRDFRRKIIEHKMCVSIFSTTLIRDVFHSMKN